MRRIPILDYYGINVDESAPPRFPIFLSLSYTGMAFVLQQVICDGFPFWHSEWSYLGIGFSLSALLLTPLFAGVSLWRNERYFFGAFFAILLCIPFLTTPIWLVIAVVWFKARAGIRNRRGPLERELGE